MAQLKNIPKIEHLTKKIPKDQLNTLKSLWDNFLETKGWPKGKRFRKDQGRLEVERVVSESENRGEGAALSCLGFNPSLRPSEAEGSCTP